MSNFLSYRSFIFKKLLFKNFLLYKIISVKFFFTNNTFFNFYILWFFKIFYFFYKNFLFFIGFCKNFFFRRYSYNFFFNYDFNSFLERIFSFFSLVLTRFSYKYTLYFSVIFDDLFSNFTIIFQNTDYFNVDLSTIKTASFFFNKVIIYNYWFYNMNWLHNSNVLNKLRARIYPLEPVKGSLYGFKFHFRGRFSRKQRAGSFVFSRGNMPLTTLSANIDYGFITMPLVNSLVSIKVWLFRSVWLKDASLGFISHNKLLRLPFSIYEDVFLRKILSEKFLKKFRRKTKYKKLKLKFFNKELFKLHKKFIIKQLKFRSNIKRKYKAFRLSFIFRKLFFKLHFKTKKWRLKKAFKSKFFNLSNLRSIASLSKPCFKRYKSFSKKIFWYKKRWFRGFFYRIKPFNYYNIYFFDFLKKFSRGNFFKNIFFDSNIFSKFFYTYKKISFKRFNFFKLNGFWLKKQSFFIPNQNVKESFSSVYEVSDDKNSDIIDNDFFEYNLKPLQLRFLKKLDENTVNKSNFFMKEFDLKKNISIGKASYPFFYFFNMYFFQRNARRQTLNLKFFFWRNFRSTSSNFFFMNRSIFFKNLFLKRKWIVLKFFNSNLKVFFNKRPFVKKDFFLFYDRIYIRGNGF